MPVMPEALNGSWKSQAARNKLPHRLPRSRTLGVRNRTVMSTMPPGDMLFNVPRSLRNSLR